MTSTDPVAAPPRCYAHPDRLAGSVCRRCNRPICPDCMVEAPVGWQCRSCVKGDARRAPVTRWRPAGPGRLGTSRLSPVVIGLIVVNVVVYLWESHTKVIVYVQPWLPRPVLCQSAVCHYALLPAGVHHGQWYRLITSAFLHASFEHILFNMITLAIIGSAVEAELGSVRFIALYLVSALGGSVASYLLSKPDQLGVGASGAIFGLMGAYFVLARYRRWETRTIAALIVINLIISFAEPLIDWRVHIGGLVTGALVAWGMHRTANRAAGVMVAVGAAVVLSVLVLLPPGHVNL